LPRTCNKNGGGKKKRHFSIFLRYITDLKGQSKSRLIETSQEMMKKQENEEKKRFI